MTLGFAQHSSGPCAAAVVAALVATIAPGSTAAAQDLSAAEQKGLDIALAAREKRLGFGNFTARQNMLLRNKRGQESQRELRVKVMEVDGDGDMSLFVFDEPRDVQGTAFLIHAHKDKGDDQWLFLPALKRVKRISSGNRSGSFMGSEFAYEDMTPPEVEKFGYRHLRDEACGDLTCTVVERIPMDERSGYSRHTVWRDTEELRTWRVEYFDRKDAHLKTLNIDGYERYLDRYWQAGEMTMVNHLTGKTTTLTWTDYDFQTDLDANDFTQNGLRRAR